MDKIAVSNKYWNKLAIGSTLLCVLGILLTHKEILLSIFLIFPLITGIISFSQIRNTGEKGKFISAVTILVSLIHLIFLLLATIIVTLDIQYS